VQFTQIQDEVIDKAHCEGKVNPAAFASGMHHDLDDVHAAINDLVNRGLIAAAEGDTFHLTDQGEAIHRRQEEADRAAVISRTPTWQPR
jgi:predicted transcriptional regulator